MVGETTLAILRRLFDTQSAGLSALLAEAVLQIHFAEADQARMGELAAKSNQGVLSEQEAEEYDGYIAAAELLSLWHSKARLALKPHSTAA
jgi:cytosine/adenosine deaminase-related metal-dependent hydrolase